MTELTETSSASPLFTVLPPPQPLPITYPFGERKRRFALDLAEQTAAQHMPATKRAATSSSTYEYRSEPYIINIPPTDDDDEDDLELNESTTSVSNVVHFPTVLHNQTYCQTCSKTPAERYSVRECSNYGLLHTLYAYRVFFTQLFALYRQRKEEKKMSAELRGKFKGLLHAYNIGYRSRPVSLRDPMEKDMANQYVTVNGWVCPALSRALYRAFIVIVGGTQYRESMVDNKFFHDVVLPTLVYLHETLTRRAKEKKEKKRNAPFKLDIIQDESSAALSSDNPSAADAAAAVTIDKFLKFLKTEGVQSAEHYIPAFALQQAQARIAIYDNGGANQQRQFREGRLLLAELPVATMGAIEKVLFDYRDELITLEETEQAFCAALVANGRSGVDYLLPGQTVYVSKANDQVKFDMSTRRVVYIVGDDDAMVVAAATTAATAATTQ
jgi:hypothetical protein